MPLSEPQREVIASNKRFRVLITGRRFGKTHLCMMELLRKGRDNPNGKIFYVSPTYRMSKEIMWKNLKKTIKKLRWEKYINETELTVVLKNNCQISLKGADKSADNLRGVGLNFLVLDEFSDIPPEAWSESLRPTISDKHVQGSVLFVGTPKGVGNWSYDLFQKGKSGDPEWQSWKYTTVEGGQVEPHEIEQAKKDLDERSFKQEYLASFETYAGVIYYNFERENNVKPCKYDPEAIIHVGLDFNIDPMSASIGVRQGERLHIVDEIRMFSSNTQEMVQEIKSRYPTSKIQVYPDPASRQRKTSAGGMTDLSILQNAGFVVKAPLSHDPVRDGINAVNSKLCDANGVRNLLIDPKCKHTIESLERHAYKEGTSIPDKDSGYDHMSDALRYMVAYIWPVKRDVKPMPAQRWSHRIN